MATPHEKHRQWAALMREDGWVCVEPANEEAPEIKVGQVWVSGKARVEPRTIVAVGKRPYWDEDCVSFTTPTSPAHPKYGPRALRVSRWRRWATGCHARPTTPTAVEPGSEGS